MLDRIWEFLRAKLQQRTQPEFFPFLSLADEYAWLCYQPVYQRGFKEPPLVYLNGGYSPFILTRHKEFQAEVVPRELIIDRTLRQAMASLPFPVIGVPWYQISSLADLTVLGHEVGHSVEVDLELTPQLDHALSSAVGPPWIAWRSELFADLYGCLCGGPAFVTALAEFLSAEDQSAVHPDYPLPAVRFAFNLAVLEFQGHDVASLRNTYTSTYPEDGTALFAEAKVAATKMIEAVSGNLSINFDANMNASAREIARSVVISNDQITGYYGLPILTAAYRYAFDSAISLGTVKLSRLARIETKMHAAVATGLRSGLRSGEVARPAPDFSQTSELWHSQLKRSASA